MSSKAETRYAVTTDGVHIAYQTRGEGEDDVVWIPGFAASFEIELEDRQTSSMIDAVAQRWRVVMFDKRGSGQSDRSNTPDLEKRADDLRAVLDAVGSSSAILVGQGEGGALAAFFAATYPERVRALIPMFSWARIAWAPDYPDGMPYEAFRADTERLRDGWGTVEYAREWAEAEMPSRVADGDFLRYMARAMRFGASPAAALEFQEIWYATDVRAVLGSIQTPTLVMTGEDFVGAAEGADSNALSKYMADHIPGARMLYMPGADFVPFGGDPTSFVDTISEFVESTRADLADFDRILATVLFTDIVGSTQKAAEIGDRAWKETLQRHNDVVRALLGRYRGEEINSTGDGFLAVFDGPGRAIRCARALCAAVHPLGLELRAGLHTGEIERLGNDIGGIAVHIAARVSALSDASQVLVTSTVRDLVAGSGLNFEDAGAHVLKGIPGDWQLYRTADESQT